MGFFKPTIVEVAIAIVFFFLTLFLTNLVLGIYCAPVPSMGAWIDAPAGYHYPAVEAYPCGPISRALSSHASETDANNLRIIVAAIALSVPCLMLFLAQLVKLQQKSAGRKK